jgi:hypothetical protein
MIQIIPSNKKPSKWEQIGNALSGGISAGLGAYQEHQKKKQLSQALQDVQGIYSNPDMDEQQKFIQAFSKLSQFPDAAKELTSGLSRAGVQKGKAQEFAAKMKEQEENKKAMYSFGDKLKKQNPDNPMYQTIGDIYQSGMSADETSHIVRALTGIDPFKMQQQNRLQLDSVLKRYSQRIKEIDDEIKNSRMGDRQPLIEQKRALQGERDELLGFKALMDEEEEMEAEEGFEEEDLEEQSKVAFDANNKEHKAKAQQLYKKYKDKEKVRKILSKEFSGL